MMESLTNAFLLSLLVLAAAVCILGPLVALGVIFWHWHKELKYTSRLRVSRTTQTK